MIAVAFGLAWIGYTLWLWGYVLLSGRNVGFMQLVSPTKWLTPPFPAAGSASNTVIFPNGTSATGSGSSVNLLDTVQNQAPAGSSGGSSGGGPGISANGSGSGNASADILKAATQAGWGSGPDWSDIQAILAIESGGNPTVANTTESCGGGNFAYGLAQACGHAGAGESGCGHNAYGGYGLSSSQAQQANCGNAYYQAVWMMNYIKATYGSPAAALAEEHKAGGY